MVCCRGGVPGALLYGWLKLEPQGWCLPEGITLKMLMEHWYFGDPPTVYPLKGLSMSALRHNKGDPVKLGRMQRFMKEVVQIGMREGIDMTGELEERKLGGRYEVVLENMVAKKTEKHARRKKELSWETFYRHYKLRKVDSTRALG